MTTTIPNAAITIDVDTAGEVAMELNFHEAKDRIEDPALSGWSPSTNCHMVEISSAARLVMLTPANARQFAKQLVQADAELPKPSGPIVA